MPRSKENALQYDLFTGELVDNRSSYQKRLDQERQAPQQLLMFATREVVQLGENVRPWLSEMDRSALILEQEDPRTPEEIKRDLQQQAQALTFSLFEAKAASQPAPLLDPAPTPAAVGPKRVLIPIYIATVAKPDSLVTREGYRRKQRRARVRCRSRSTTLTGPKAGR